MVSYIRNIIKYKKWQILISIGLLALLIQGTLFLLQPSILNLLELNKCPTCYGLSSCDFIYEIDIKPETLVSLLMYLIDVKNVFFGVYKGQKVVLKKLAHNSELDAFDRIVCTDDRFVHFCTNGENRQTFRNVDVDYYKLIEETITLNYTTDDRSRLRLCPNTQRLPELFHNVYTRIRHVDKDILNIHLWTLVSLNPEPIILQILPSEDGWPVPKYFGACGRVVIEEYVGLPIGNFYNEPWLRRAKIISNLLEAIHMLTFRNEQFGFYLTDVSVDNIAIDTQDKAKFIDMENIIIVDKHISEKDKSEKWHELQENVPDITCINCLAFSPVDICSHHLSDHNYHAVCQILLNPKTSDSAIPGGFLHDIPTSISRRYLIEYLIERCTFPTPTQNRINSGQQLKQLLDEIVKAEAV